MRTLVGWMFKLGFLGLIYVGMTSGFRIQLPDEVLGYKVPPSAQQWVDRNAQIGDYGKSTKASFEGIADSLAKK
jgi:hypothetical protein